jgi:hypothetical protein
LGVEEAGDGDDEEYGVHTLTVSTWSIRER